MAGVQGSALAIAVSNAGGLGSLPCAMLRPDGDPRGARRDHRRDARSRTTSTSSATSSPHADRRARGGVAQGARAVLRRARHRPGRRFPPGPAACRSAPRRPTCWRSSSRRSSAFISACRRRICVARVKRWGAKILSSATTVDEARWLEAHGVDAVIAQGLEAGGHRGMFLSSDLNTQVGTLALVPQIAQAVKVPVIAAGGIADATGVRAAMALGAAGVQVGTAYLLCPEATTSAAAPRGAEERRRRVNGDHQRLHRPPGARHRESPDAGARSDQRRGAGVSAGGGRDRSAAREGRGLAAAATSRRCGPGRMRAAARRCRRRSDTRELAQGRADVPAWTDLHGRCSRGGVCVLLDGVFPSS